MKRWQKRLTKKPNVLIAPGLIILFAVIGIHYLVASHAATPYVTGEAEQGQLYGSASVQPDTTSQSGSPVRFGSTSSFCKPSQLPQASIDTALDSAISGQLGPGWIGADVSYSASLPDGRVAFDFSDTLIGTAQADGASTITGFIHNSELVGNAPSLTADYGGTYSAPESLITDSNNTTDLWAVAATYVENGKQLIFVNQFIPGSPFDTYTGVSGIAVMNVPTNGLPTLSSVTALPTDAATQWGNAAFSDSQYHYIYGLADSNNSQMKIARVPLNETLTTADWQYWNGTAWVSGEANAVAVNTTNELTGVNPASTGGYMAVSIPGSVYTDNTLDVSYACQPQGPWSAPVAIYTIPEISQYSADGEIAYMSTFHPEITSSNGMVVSYSIDTLDGLTPLTTNIHEYQPRFLFLK